MESTLPIEILITIFRQLHPVDQVKCMLVCHRWNELIEDHALYHTVFLYSLVSLKKLLQKIQQRPDIAKKIERLRLYGLDKEEGDRLGFDGVDEEEYFTNCRKLLTLIPNLKVLSHNAPTVLKNNTRYPWCNQIEYVSESRSENEVDYFLSSDIYPNLKTFQTYYYGRSNTVIKNASGLTSLVLKNVILDFDDLEEIHRNAPNLKSLKFDSLYYDGGTDFSGKVITPATSVTKLVAHVRCDDHNVDANTSHPELHAEFMLYISRKYSNLSTLKYRSCGFTGPDDDYEVILTGLNPLLQRLGPQLKKTYIRLSIEQEELVETFDRLGCQLHHLDLYFSFHERLVEMAQSKQVSYIQNLTLGITSPSVDWLKGFRVLKKLKLYEAEYDQSFTMQFSDILDNSPPTLESLTLDFYNLDIDPSYTGTSNIKKLSFHYTDFNDKVDGFISRCFPQLSELKLRDCTLQNNRLNLPKTDLTNFSYYNNDDHVLLVTTLKDNKRRSYVLHSRQRAYGKVFYPQNYRPFKSYPANNINDSVPALNFTCNSVRNVVFMDECHRILTMVL